MPIAANLLKKWGRICGKKSEDSWYGLARYWGTLRDNKSHYSYSYLPMIKYMQSLQFLEVSKPVSALRLGVIVGHEKIAPGATFAAPWGKVAEYEYNSEVADLMHKYAEKLGVDLMIFTRDNVGISGGYRKAQAAKCDVAIELHCNAFNRQVQGSEVLCSSEQSDKALAAHIQAGLIRLFKREGNANRGVKIRNSGRGAENCTSYPGKANCLVEPAFCDNTQDAQMLMDMKIEYAQMLVDQMVRYWSAASK